LARRHARGIAQPSGEIVAVAIEPVAPPFPSQGGGAPLRPLLTGEFVGCRHGHTLSQMRRSGNLIDNGRRYPTTSGVISRRSERMNQSEPAVNPERILQTGLVGPDSMVIGIK
jgi:hypothetical protein